MGVFAQEDCLRARRVWSASWHNGAQLAPNFRIGAIHVSGSYCRFCGAGGFRFAFRDIATLGFCSEGLGSCPPLFGGSLPYSVSYVKEGKRQHDNSI